MNKNIKYTVPHCKHCINYHESTGSCIVILKNLYNSSKRSAKAYGSRCCKQFKPTQYYKKYYKHLQNENIL